MQTHAADLEELLQPHQPQVATPSNLSHTFSQKSLFTFDSTRTTTHNPEFVEMFWFCLESKRIIVNLSFLCVCVWSSDSGRGSSLLDRAIADRRQLNAMTLPDFSDPETGIHAHTHTHTPTHRDKMAPCVSLRKIMKHY